MDRIDYRDAIASKNVHIHWCKSKGIVGMSKWPTMDDFSQQWPDLCMIKWNCCHGHGAHGWFYVYFEIMTGYWLEVEQVYLNDLLMNITDSRDAIASKKSSCIKGIEILL